MGTPDGETEDWKGKYETCTAKYNTLEILSKDVLKEYDTLSKKFEEETKQREALQQKLVDKDKQLKEVKNLIQPALTEYDKLKNKYEIEKGCRYQAQSYATQITKQNHKLKRQSMGLLQVLDTQQISIQDINIDDVGEDETDNVEADYKTELNTTIKELKDEVSTLKVTVSQTEQDLHIEKENYRWAAERYTALKTELKDTQLSLKQHQDAIQELSQVSEAAYEEYEGLKGKYELEVKHRNFVEKKVVEYAEENNKMKRQSNALMLNVTPGDKLHQALMEIEDLSDKLDKQRKVYETQIEGLEEQIKQRSEGVSEEETQHRHVVQLEMDGLNTSLQEALEKFTQLETEHTELLNKYEEALKPKPPPPPPPPPPPATQNKGILGLFSKKKKIDIEAKQKLGGANTSPDFSKALDEMMENIKKGRALRPTLKPIKKETGTEGKAEFRMILKSRSFDDDSDFQKTEKQEGPAMAELHNLVNKMKRVQSESDLLSPLEQGDDESELAKTFKKVRKQPSLDAAPVVQRNKPLSQVPEERDSELL